MITIIRRNQRWLLLLVAIMTIIAFAWLYNTTDTEQLGANKVAQMYGQTIYRVDVDRAVRVRQLAAILGLNEFLGELSATAASQEQAFEEFIWNLLVLRHEAGVLWLQPTDAQVLEAIRALPALQTNGTFDRNLYVNLLQEQLAPRGLTERHLEDLIRDTLTLRSLRAIITSPVTLLPGEVEETLRFFQTVDATVIRLPGLPPEVAIAVTPEEVAQFFEENQADLQTPAYRSVELVQLSLPENEASFEGKEKVQALQRVADRVSTLHDALLLPDADFSKLVAESAATVRQTPLFDAQGQQPGADPATPGESAGVPAPVVAQAFRLRSGEALSEIIQDGDSFYFFRPLQSVEPRPLTLAEATPQIEQMLLARARDAAEAEKASGFRASIAQALAADSPVADAAAAQGLSIEERPGLQPWQQSMDENFFFGRAAVGLAEGELSDVQRGFAGSFLLYVNKRHPVSPDLRAEREEEVRETLLKNRQAILFYEWLRQAREASDLRFFHQQG